MRILFVADLHYTLKQFDWLVGAAGSYDAVIIGGDLLDLASALDFDVQIVVVEKYLTRLRQKTRLFVCSGNHDGDSRNSADESIASWIQESKAENVFVDGDFLEWGDMLITICPWWDGPQSCAEIEAQLVRDAEKRRNRWIWIHHAPPANSPVCWTGRQSIGDEYLRQWIERFSPDFVLSGHIHNAPFFAEGAWADRIGKTWVFNPGRQIGDFPTSIAFDLEAMTAEWISYEGKSTRQLAVADG